MILDVDFRYSAKLIPYRKRNPIEANFRSRVAVEVPEIAESDAPLAFRYADPDTFYLSDEPPAEAMVEVRKIGGILYEPYLLRDTTPPQRMKADDLVRAAADAVSRDHSGFDPLGCATARWRQVDSEPRDFPRAKAVSDTRDKVASDIRERASRLALVEGTLYRATREPVYNIQSHNYTKILRLPSTEIRHRSTYRADELEVMPEHARRSLDNRGTIEVLDPSAITYMGPQFAAVEEAEAILESLKSSLHSWTVEAFARYATLRDVVAPLAQGRQAPDEGAMDALVGALKELQREDLGDSYWHGSIDVLMGRLDALAMRSLSMEGPQP